jgi:hypothetical protein
MKTQSNKIIAGICALAVGVAGMLLVVTNAAQNPAADLNDDDQVNIFDLSLLLSKWGQTGAGNIADINADNVVSIFDLSILLASWGPLSGNPSGDLALARIPWEGGPAYYSQFPKANQSGWDEATFFPISVFLGNTDPYVLDEYKDAGVNTLLAVQKQSPIATVTGKGLFAIPHIEPEGRYDDWTSAEVGNDPGVVGWFATDECEMGYSGCADHTLTSAQCDTAFDTNDTDKTRLYADRAECKSIAAKNLAECSPLDSAKYESDGECWQWVYQKHLADFLRAKNDGRFVAANFGNGIARTFWSPNTLDSHYNYMDLTAVDKYAYTSKGAAGVLTDNEWNFGSYDWPQGAVGNRAATYGFMADQFKRVQNTASLRPIGVMVETGTPLIDAPNDCWTAPSCNITPDQIEGAVWSAIRHEARHISYFDFNNGPTCGSMVDCPVVHDKVKAINSKIKSLAPVLNTQSYYNDSYANNGTTFYRYTFNNGTDTMLKTYGGSAYIFAGLGMDITGQHSGSDWCGTVDGKAACKNIGANHTTGSKTFTLPAGVNGTTVEVVGEGRFLTVNGSRQFTDNFAAEYSNHVYKVSLNAVSGSCALPNYPDETCTGVPSGVTLTNYTGPASPAAGTVIDGKNITQCLNITQPGVVIQNSRITHSCSYGIDSWVTSTDPDDWTQIIDSEVICTNLGAGIGERGVIVKRVEIKGCENGMDLDQDGLVEDSYIHSLDEGPTGDGHGDGIQSAILQNITIRHNTIIGRTGNLTTPGLNATSAIITPPNGTSNTLIENNFLAGGAASIYCPENSPVNVRVLNNTFAVRSGPLGAAFAYSDGCDSGTVWSGNYTNTGVAVGSNQ